MIEENRKKSLISFSKFDVTSADADMFGRIKLGSICNFLIQSAIQSADKMGFGFKELRKESLFWVLSRLTVKIERPVYWKEKIEIETWPKDVERIIYIRDYHLKEGDNNNFASCTSGWLAIDLRTKRPKKVEGTDAELFNYLRDKKALTDPPAKLNPLSDGEEFKFTTSYFDIDLNKHTTSTRYVDWMMDTFSSGFHEKNYPKKLETNYLKETMLGETVKLLKVDNGDNSYTFEGINETKQIPAFRGKIYF